MDYLNVLYGTGGRGVGLRIISLGAVVTAVAVVAAWLQVLS